MNRIICFSTLVVILLIAVIAGHFAHNMHKKMMQAAFSSWLRDSVAKNKDVESEISRLKKENKAMVTFQSRTHPGACK